MPDKGFKTVTVTDELYQKIKQRAKRENKSAATFVSEILEIMLYVEDNFANSNYAPFLELVQLGDNEVILRDNKRDHQIVGVRAKPSDGRKISFYCELDRRDDCPHAAFAAALPQVRNAVRR
jgi:predicted DNA-binding protein